jgi:hypothetical protein
MDLELTRLRMRSSACAIAAIAFGVAVTLFCVFGIPWLWHLLKPALHTLTA